MDEAVSQSAVLLRDAEVQAQFNDYYYDYSAPAVKDAGLLAEPVKPQMQQPKAEKQEGEPVAASDVHIAA